MPSSAAVELGNFRIFIDAATLKGYFVDVHEAVDSSDFRIFIDAATLKGFIRGRGLIGERPISASL